MKFPRIRTIVLVPLILFALFYLTGVVLLLLDDRTVAPLEGPYDSQQTVAI